MRTQTQTQTLKASQRRTLGVDRLPKNRDPRPADHHRDRRAVKTQLRTQNW